MNKCLICGKRIWFFQKKLKTEDKVIHLKCSLKEDIETPKEEITGATIDSTTEEDNSLQETSDGLLECEKEKEVKNELSLSEKILEAKDVLPEAKVLFVADVQEFIKNLKKVLFDDPEPCCMGVRQNEAFRKIDKLAGDNLI
ncbi:MAG: hypothetical protein WC758_07565 [Candidatus Woesearchaeota archaeon]|jgi:hypothetical protein